MNYNEKTVSELRTLARENGLRGAIVVSMTKDQLIDYLTNGNRPNSTESKPLPTTNNQQNNDLADVIAQAISGKISTSINREEVEKIIENKIKDLTLPRRIIVENTKNENPIDVGVQHRIFPKVLKLAENRVNVSIVGPSGSGKTTLTENVAKALDLEFYTLSVGLQTTKTDLIGYMDANGKYVSTALRKAFEFGGVFLLDELDAGNAGVLTIINAMTSNGVANFPDGMIKKHKDFILIAASNTYGRGSDRLYVGRNQLDAATLDRFAVINMDYDEDLERLISPLSDWTDYVQKLRKSVYKLKERVVISPRASIYGGKLILAGLDRNEVENMLIWKGIDNQLIEKIKKGAEA